MVLFGECCRILISVSEPFQFCNKIPGLSILTRKETLSTLSGLPFMPAGFSIPRDREKFERHREENPGAKFLIKGKSHQGIT